MGERIVVIGRRFRGPDLGGGTGNGGYVCGVVALAAGPGPRGVEIRRAAGVPLDRPLVMRVEEGDAVLSDDEGVIARTTSADLAGAVPAPPGLEVARRVSTRFLEGLESGEIRHTFPECFVCGHRRGPGDGLRVFAGPVDEGLGDQAGTRVGAWKAGCGVPR